MKCKACKMDIPNGAKICPHCRTKQGTGCAGVLAVLLILFIGIPILNGIGSANNKSKNESSVQTTTEVTTTPPISSHEIKTTTAASSENETTKLPKMNGFIIGDRDGTTYDDYCHIVGVVANATGQDCSYVQITIGLYNKNGVKINSAMDNVLNLAAGETWQYEVYGYGSGISEFKIEDITWY